MEFTITQIGARSLVFQGYKNVVGKAHPNDCEVFLVQLATSAASPQCCRSIIHRD